MSSSIDAYLEWVDCSQIGVAQSEILEILSFNCFYSIEVFHRRKKLLECP